MNTPAILAIMVVMLSLCFQIRKFLKRNRERHLWLERDMAMTQAFHHALERGDFEGAWELHQERRRDFDKHFNPQH